jgi:hypothetical protein
VHSGSSESCLVDVTNYDQDHHHHDKIFPFSFSSLLASLVTCNEEWYNRPDSQVNPRYQYRLNVSPNLARKLLFSIRSTCDPSVESGFTVDMMIAALSMSLIAYWAGPDVQGRSG